MESKVLFEKLEGLKLKSVKVDLAVMDDISKRNSPEARKIKSLL